MKLNQGKMKDIALKLIVFMIVLLGLGNILATLPFNTDTLRDFDRNYSLFSSHIIVIHRSFSFLSGLILIFVSFRLYKRVQSAYWVTVATLCLSIYMHFTGFHRPIPLVFIELLILLLLFLSRRGFSRKSDPITLKWGVILSAFSLAMVLGNTVAGLFMIKQHFFGVTTLVDSFSQSLRLLFLMDISGVAHRNHLAYVYARSVIFLNWSVIILSMVLILTPLIYQPRANKNDRDKVRQLLRLYGQNPSSYLALEEDKTYFFSRNVEGAIAYMLVGNVAICAGDPLCDENDMALFISEFMIFCRKNELQICFMQVLPRLVPILKSLGFGVTKYGEECLFELSRHTLDGSEASRLRQGLRKAEKLGIHVEEYKPHIRRCPETEKQISQVSEEWLENKKGGEMKFMLGSVSLEKPLDRRYFLALDSDGKLQGFIVYVPYGGGKGYMADVTRRRHDAPFGVMEKLTIDSFAILKAEGVVWGSLGLAPLYNVKNDSDSAILIKNVLNYAYENLNAFYGFKSLYQYKKKYVPTAWEPRYLAFSPKNISPQIAYAIVKSQNPHIITDYLLANIKRLFFKERRSLIF